MIRISIIVPAWNEEASIGAAITSARSAPDVDIVVVDGGSTDRTTAVAAAHGARILSAPRGRASQMNAGWRACRGDLVVFLHADTTLPAGYAAIVRDTLANADTALGAFRLRIDGAGLALRCIERGVALRARWLRSPYGDQALFLRRATLEQLDGYRALPVLEDVDLVRRARSLGRITLVRAAVTTSPRSWQQHGPIRTTLAHQRALLAHRFGACPHRIAARLRAPPRPRPLRSSALLLIPAAVLAGGLALGSGCHATSAAAAVSAPDVDSIVLGAFEPVPLASQGWRLEEFDGVRPTRYEVVAGDDGAWLRATSRDQAALLTKATALDPTQHRHLSWRWRVEQLPGRTDLRTRDGDDCAARVFVSFAYEPARASLAERVARTFQSQELPGSALCYVWARDLPVGTILPNAYAAQTRMVVLRSGTGGVGAWHTERRDVLADYRAAFDREPPPITGIAVMVDTDQTGGSAVAEFAGITIAR